MVRKIAQMWSFNTLLLHMYTRFFYEDNLESENNVIFPREKINKQRS